MRVERLAVGKAKAALHEQFHILFEVHHRNLYQQKMWMRKVQKPILGARMSFF